MTNTGKFRKKLQNELLLRLKKNSNYSIRAFAKALEIESSSLSQIINGKRPLTLKMCQRLGKRLGLSPDEINFLTDQKVESDKKIKAPSLERVFKLRLITIRRRASEG